MAAPLPGAITTTRRARRSRRRHSRSSAPRDSDGSSHGDAVRPGGVASSRRLGGVIACRNPMLRSLLACSTSLTVRQRQRPAAHEPSARVTRRARTRTRSRPLHTPAMGTSQSPADAGPLRYAHRRFQRCTLALCDTRETTYQTAALGGGLHLAAVTARWSEGARGRPLGDGLPFARCAGCSSALRRRALRLWRCDGGKGGWRGCRSSPTARRSSSSSAP